MNCNGKKEKVKKEKKITFENYQYVVSVILASKDFRIPRCLEIQDLYQMGCIALLDAIKIYNPKNKKRKGGFGSYAYWLIYFRIIDELRRITKIRRRKGKKEYNPMETGMFSESSYFTVTIRDNGDLQEMIT